MGSVRDWGSLSPGVFFLRCCFSAILVSGPGLASEGVGTSVNR